MPETPTDALVRNIEKAGDRIGGILQERWQTKQAEDFMQNEFQMFQQATAQFQNSLAAIEDGDQLAQSFTQWKNNTLMPFMANATAKYSSNPKIMAIAEKIFEANKQGLQEYLSVEEAGRERELQTPIEEERRLRAREREAGIQAKEAGVEERQASAALKRAQAGAVSREEKPDPLSQSVIPPERLNTISFSEARHLVNDPRFAQWKASIDERTNTAAVSRIVSENIGKEKPDGTKWGEYPEKDTADATRIWASSPQWSKTMEAARLQAAGYSLDRAQGYYDDVKKFLQGAGSPLTPEEITPPIKSDANESMVLGRMLSSTSDNMRQMGWNFESVDGFIKNTLPDLPMSETGYRMLGPHVTTVLESGAFRDADGAPMARLETPTGSVQQVPLNNYQDLVKALKLSWYRRVTEKQFSPEATRHKENSNKFGDAVIRRYAPIIARRIGIEVPKRVLTEIERASEPTLLKLLRPIGELGKGILDYDYFNEDSFREEIK